MTEQEKQLKADFNWLVKNTARLQQKLAGKFIAVINRRIVGTGSSAKEAYAKAKKAFPHREPLLDMVPSKEFLLL